jgi:ribosomal protein L7/L12
MSITSEAKQEVARLLGQGQKIEAIKYIKETFNISLLDAKNLVDAVESEVGAGTFRTIEVPPQAAPPEALPSQLSGESKVHVSNLLQTGKKMEAIKYVRQSFNVGLNEALDMVESVEKEIDPNFVPSSVGCRPVVSKVVGTILGFVALILFGIACFTYYAKAKLIDHGQKTTGTIVRLEWNDDTAAAVIQYQWQGKTIERVDNLYSKPPAYDVGETIALYVSHENKEDIVIDSFSDRWLAITILGSMTIIFGFVSYMMLKPSRRF